MSNGKTLKEVLRRNSRPTDKKPLEVELAEARYLRQLTEVRLFEVSLVEEANDPRDSFIVMHGRILQIAADAPTRFLLRIESTVQAHEDGQGDLSYNAAAQMQTILF